LRVRRFAISLPEDVVTRVEQAAAARGVTRSRFITDVLRRVAGAQSDAEITRRLDDVFSEPSVEREQRTTNDVVRRSRRGAADRW
jgi:hypothetical protein